MAHFLRSVYGSWLPNCGQKSVFSPIFAIFRPNNILTSKKCQDMTILGHLEFSNVHHAAHCAQWAGKPILWTLAKSWPKYRTLHVFLGDLKTFYSSWQEKITKCKIWPFMWAYVKFWKCPKNDQNDFPGSWD